MESITDDKQLQEPLQQNGAVSILFDSCTLEYLHQEKEEGEAKGGGSDGCWNQERSTVPDFLEQQNIPLAVWQATYDDILKLNKDFPRNEYNAIAAVGGVLFSLSVLGIFMIPDDDEQNTSANAINFFVMLAGILLYMWATCISQRPRNIASGRLLYNQVAIYRPYGVSVMWLPLRGTTTTAFKFQRQQEPTTMNNNNNNSLSLSFELERLYNLHTSGALTDTEYSQAKAMVLNLPTSPATIEEADVEDIGQIV